MLIEFTGCTSAGKTKVISDTLKLLQEKNVHVEMSYDYILNKFGIFIDNKIFKSIAVEILLIPVVIMWLTKYLHYYIFACKLIVRRKDYTLKKFNILRNLFKQVAVYEFVVKRNPDNFYILLDECTVHLINNIFVHYKTLPNLDVLSKFLPQVPLPDKIIIVDAPIKMIVDRALERKDPPRKHLTRENWETLAKNASMVFGKLIDYDNKSKKLLLVHNVDGNQNGKNIAEKIVNFILNPPK